jgi:hypothetical protein
VAFSYAQDLDERVRSIVKRTLAAQGLQLQVQDPVALHVVAQHVLAVGDRP